MTSANRSFLFSARHGIVRIYGTVRNILLLLAVVSPGVGYAQFQQPTDEELKMTADPKAPGADAVYLNIEEIANDPLGYQSTYVRIKVLTENGKKLSTIEAPYVQGTTKITDFKARTIHPDGTVIPLEGKPEDLFSSKSDGKQIGRRVINMPSVEVGSILEYSYIVRYDDNRFSSPMWEIQRPYFVHKAHYVFTPFQQFMPNNTSSSNRYLVDSKGNAINNLIWWYKLPEGVTVKTDVGGRYSVDVTDIPPIPDEEWMPPTRNFLYKVFFYYKSSFSAKDFWVTEAKSWSKDVDHFAEQSSTIKEAVSGLIAPGDSELVKAKKLYAAVQALDNTDYSRRKSESERKQLKLKTAKHAEDTWKQKSGNSEDIALLYLAMARAAGLQAFAMKVVARDRGVFDVSYMELDQLDDTIVIVGIDGKGVLLDPGEKLCPFQTLSWRHSKAGGLRQSSAGPGYEETPQQPYAGNNTRRIGDIVLDAHGAITGSFQFTMTGQEALRWRHSALENDETELKKQFDRSLETLMPEGVEGHVDRFTGLDQTETDLAAFVTVKGTLGTATAKRLLLPGYFFEARGHTPFVAQEKRQEPVDMHYGDRVSEQITYHLPAGMVVEGAPPDTNIPWTGHAVFVTKSISAPGQIIVARTLARGFTEAKPEEYQDLRGYYEKIAAADRAQLVLAVSSTTQGK